MDYAASVRINRYCVAEILAFSLIVSEALNVSASCVQSFLCLSVDGLYGMHSLPASRGFCVCVSVGSDSVWLTSV